VSEMRVVGRFKRTTGVRHERLERDNHRGVPNEREQGRRDFRSAPLVLVHHRGPKSGQEYVTPMMYLPHDADPNVIYVFATRGGTPVNWYYNVTADSEGSVER
jgi:F420H(2)-dependent quinone reductase